MSKNKLIGAILLILLLSVSGCSFSTSNPKPRLAMFVGVDISGSFMNGKYFDDSIDFLAHYIYCHLNGLGGFEVPHALFVSRQSDPARPPVCSESPLHHSERRDGRPLCLHVR